MSLSRRFHAVVRRALVVAILVSSSLAAPAAGTSGVAAAPAAGVVPGPAAAATAAPRISAGFAFHAVAPARIADSRTGKGVSKLRAGTAAALQVTGTAGIPSGAAAVAVNVTVVRPSRAGYVAVTPVRQTPASVATSMVNFAAGEIVAAGTTVPLGTDGRLWLLYAGGVATDSTHVVVDVTGYYAGTTGLTFHAVAPARLGLTALRSGVPAPLAVRGTPGVPSTATAVVGTLTARGATGSGYVAVNATQVAPASLGTSALNVDLRQTRSNGIVASLGSDGRLWLAYVGAAPTDTLDATLDVTGYFAPDASGTVLHPAGPARIADSRTGRGRLVRLTSGVPVALAVTGMVGVGAGTTGVTGTLTAVRARGAGTIALTASKPSGAPSTVSLSFAAGEIRAAGVTMPLAANGTVWLTYTGSAAGDTVDAVFDLTGAFAPQTAAGAIPAKYFRAWMPSAAWITDASGVIVVDYGGSIGRQYNPETIAAGAIAYYDRWQFTTESDAARAADSKAFYTQLEWLVRNQTADGRWLYRFHWGSQTVPWWSAIDEGTAMSALVRGYALTGDTRYLTAARRARTTFERSREAGGVTSSLAVGGKSYLVYEEYLEGYEQRVLNGWMFGIVGLYESAIYLDDPAAYADVFSADRGTSAVAALLPYYDTGSWSYYSLDTLSSLPYGPRASMTYQDIHVGQLQFLGAVTGDAVLVKYATRFQSYIYGCRASGTCPAVAADLAAPLEIVEP